MAVTADLPQWLRLEADRLEAARSLPRVHDEAWRIAVGYCELCGDASLAALRDTFYRICRETAALTLDYKGKQ